METIPRDHCEQGIPVIGCKKASKEVGAVNVADLLDIAVQEPQKPIRMDIHIPEYAYQLGSYVRFVKIQRSPFLKKSSAPSITESIDRESPESPVAGA